MLLKNLFASGQKVSLQQTGSRNLKIVGRIGKQGGRVLEIIRVPGYPDKTPGLYVFSLSILPGRNESS